MKRVLFFAFSLFIIGCDSPQRHKVDGGPMASQTSTAQHSFLTSGLKAKSQWMEGPFGNVALPSTLLVLIYDQNDRLTSLAAGEELGFFATMPSMGHPLDQPGFFEELSPGIYVNKNITFNMVGDWQMQLWIQNAQGEIQDQVQWLEIF